MQRCSLVSETTLCYIAGMSKIFFLTGSTRGLGRQVAEAALAAGHRLVATARRPEVLGDLQERYGDRVLTLALDVADAKAADAAMAAGVETFGGIDVVVNNAGYANLASVEDITLEDFREQVETNFFGVVNVTKAAVPYLRRRHDPRTGRDADRLGRRVHGGPAGQRAVPSDGRRHGQDAHHDQPVAR
jgi:NAD(P)-dependent dehydrogenase (short-subunit alcohol dehydrogenase family)